MTVFSKTDTKVIQSKGIEIEEIESQILNFEQGFPFVQLVKPAIPGDGIIVLSDDEIQTYFSLYEIQCSRYSIIKFVPASGAASRMFKELFSFLESFSGSKEEINKLLNDKDSNSAGYCIQNLSKFAFYEDLVSCIRKDGLDITTLFNNNLFDQIISYILLPAGLNYGNLPKALLQFHHYDKGPRTSAEEHLVEAALYAKDSKGRARLHFTTSPEHITPFHKLLDERKTDLGKEFDVEFDIMYSLQKPSTDTIAVDHDNKPFRDNKGQLVFRPGGHGALIDNLDDLNNDIIFIKNIDNIVPDRFKSTTYQYKKALGGLLISLKQQIDNFLDLLSTGIKENEIEDIENFCRQDLMIQFSDDFVNQSFTDRVSTLYHILNRPVRICGMVKNQGEPGGGPFWLRNTKGDVSLQIVEASQVNLKDPDQKRIFSNSTHFNPVDLVCLVKDHRGQKFNLKNFIDKSTGFISIKSKDGRELKAQELPGLWNGAMADWISIFVEVPLITFNPVKTVNDLLRETHQ